MEIEEEAGQQSEPVTTEKTAVERAETLLDNVRTALSTVQEALNPLWADPALAKRYPFIPTLVDIYKAKQTAEELLSAAQELQRFVASLEGTDRAIVYVNKYRQPDDADRSESAWWLPDQAEEETR